uniref:Intermediate capsid protein VP6 n=1 Tax=Porcine rotavirus B TaxID=449582 RepID=A0A096XE93_9REOV|nr:inner capsid protein VP6 [Porcine rotavirus B]AHI44928.1 inner capsid protein VP6 [Porcine rotavirus B]AHI44929.1 inner capsid protein VP6 [Porcine rotavirus B]AHI44930.1 inner capsid protein VP6 [Porcine rotavirus B]AHI44931.1 inner capsid protein VP6 [Porcine rotavirus B]
MDLIETVNACIRLQKRILNLAPNTNLNTAGQSTLNDYNAIASRCTGKTYALLDQTAVFTPYSINAPIISLSVRISTDDYDDMRSGINSILDVLAAAIRTEGSRYVRVIERRVVDPTVRQLIEDLKLKSLTSEISIANLAAVDTALIQPEVIETENPLYADVIEQVTHRPQMNMTGGNIRATLGRWSGNKGVITCMSGMDSEHRFTVDLKTRTTGVINVVYIPTAGTILIPMPNGRNREGKLIDVSAEMMADDFAIDFMDDDAIVQTETGVGVFSFPMCNRFRFRISPWNMQKDQDGLGTVHMTNWAQGTAARQPAISFMFETRRTFTESDYQHLSRCTPKSQYILDTVFPETSFVNKPNVDWNIQSLLTSNTQKVWCQKIAMLVSSYAAKI